MPLKAAREERDALRAQVVCRVDPRFIACNPKPATLAVVQRGARSLLCGSFRRGHTSAGWLARL